MDDARASQSQPEPPKITQSRQEPIRASQSHPKTTQNQLEPASSQ